MLAHEERRKPRPALFEQNFLNELTALGLPIGSYNLPDWNDTPAGLRACLESLFQHSPPSALIIGDLPLLMPVQQFLARRGIMIPDDVSVLSTDEDPSFAWCDPVISHITWDYRPLVRRVLGWVENVAHGREDKRQTLFDAKFVEGGTIVHH